MNITASYAKALYDLVEQEPAKGKRYLQGLRETLARRGHGNLLPRVYAEFERLSLARERSKKFSASTPESERTRQLVELYRKLISS